MKNRKFFDEITDRTGTHSIKWDRVKEGGLAMWIADMDFRTPHAVTDSIIKRAENGIFGYTDIPDEWYCAYQKWWKDRYNFSINKEWLIFTTGVIPAISSIIRKMTTPAENVVVMTPVYNMFFDSILDNGRNVLESRLVYNDGKYSIDFADLEEKLANPQTSMMILCNPHNPTGNIWDRDILDRIGKLCKKYHVLVVSDEIHCDITMCAEIIVLHVLHRQRHLILPESRQRQLSWLMKISDSVLSQDLRQTIWQRLMFLRLMRRLRHIVKVESGLTTLENICGKTGSLQKNL